MHVKAIETAYKGYRFRSRLEARWAVFFDALGIEWQYEPEGFELPDGTRYLPDFFLPKFDGGTWVEIKPTPGAEAKALAFAKAATGRFQIVLGPPDHREYALWASEYVEEDAYIPVGESHAGGEAPTPFCFRHRGNGPQLWVFHDQADANGQIPLEYVDRPVLRAIYAARSARFEFGESGAPG